MVARLLTLKLRTQKSDAAALAGVNTKSYKAKPCPPLSKPTATSSQKFEAKAISGVISHWLYTANKPCSKSPTVRKALTASSLPGCLISIASLQPITRANTAINNILLYFFISNSFFKILIQILQTTF